MDNVKRLSGKRVALLVASGFEEVQMTETQKALIAAGATTTIVSPELGLANGWHEGSWGHNFFVEVKVGDALPSQFDAILVPGGERSTRTLAENAHTKRILKGMVDSDKVVGVTGDAVRLLAMSEVAAGRTLTGDASEREAVEQAGGTWSAESTSVDGKVISCDGSEEALHQFVETFVNALDGNAGATTVEAA